MECPHLFHLPTAGSLFELHFMNRFPFQNYRYASVTLVISDLVLFAPMIRFNLQN